MVVRGEASEWRVDTIRFSTCARLDFTERNAFFTSFLTGPIPLEEVKAGVRTSVKTFASASAVWKRVKCFSSATLIEAERSRKIDKRHTKFSYVFSGCSMAIEVIEFSDFPVIL